MLFTFFVCIVAIYAVPCWIMYLSVFSHRFSSLCRVRQSYDLNWTRPIPTPHELHGTKQWKGVSILSAKFETYLQQLAKVPMSKDDVMDMTSNELDIRISPNPFKVFIYTIEQLEDTNTTRLLQFENDIQAYLNLQSPLKHYASKPKENVKIEHHIQNSLIYVMESTRVYEIH